MTDALLLLLTANVGILIWRTTGRRFDARVVKAIAAAVQRGQLRFVSVAQFEDIKDRLRRKNDGAAR